MVAEKYDVTRGAQDAFAAESHRRAHEATEAGRFDEEKFAVEVPQRKADPLSFTTDETIRPGMTPDSIAGMRPAFKKDGTVTAANASAINDGASALVVMSAEKAAELGATPMAQDHWLRHRRPQARVGDDGSRGFDSKRFRKKLGREAE